MGVLFPAAEPWYSIENLLLNYLIYATLVGIFAITMAIAAHKIEGLGPVVGGFFSVSKANIQDAMTLVEDTVDNVINKEALGPAKGSLEAGRAACRHESAAIASPSHPLLLPVAERLGMPDCRSTPCTP